MFLKKGNCIFGRLMHIIKGTSVSGAWAYVMGTKENSRIRTGAAWDVILGDIAYKLCGQEPGECGKLQEHPDLHGYPD